MDGPKDLFPASIKEVLLAAMDPAAGFHALFDYIDSVFFFAKDLEGRILFANPQLVRHYGFSKSDDMIGKTDFDFLPRSLAEEYRLDDKQVAKSKEPLIRQVELFLDDKGVPGWDMTTKFPIISKTGKAIGVMGVIQEFDASHPRFFEGRKLSELINYIKDHPLESIQPGELTRISGLSAKEDPATVPEDPEHDAPRPAHEDADPEVLRSPALHRRTHFGNRRRLRVLRPERLYPQLQETDGHNSQAVSAGGLMWVGTVPASSGSSRQKKASGQPFTSAVIVLPPTGTTACRASFAPPPLC